MPTVDENVVKLSLDDKDLDKGSKRAITSLDSLKQALKFEGVEKGLDGITEAVSKVDMNPLTEGVNLVSERFSVLETVAMSSIFNITNRAIDAGTRLVKSLSIDQVTAGWSKYADKTAAVQTIMSATSQQFEDTGEQMKFVEGELEKLNWFTDETSYRFLDMVDNIGKFTSNNIPLNESVDAMQGVATWAARSGAGVNGAARAMFNLSQAIGLGSVRLEDWGSIEAANMSTYEFKETALDTAVSLGILTKEAEGLYKTLDGTQVTITGFRESLQKGWFSSDVLIKTLERYGGFATELNKLYEALDESVPTTTLIGYIDDYAKGALDLQSVIDETGMSAAELTEWFDKLSSEEYKLGRESFKAAQETKTLQEAIDYVKEAVSSGWMTTFEHLFGNYEEAKGIFSELSERLYDMFVASGAARNEMLSLWEDNGGQEHFVNGLWGIMDAFQKIIDVTKSAWASIFPDDVETKAQWFHDVVVIFENFTQSLILTDEAAASLQDALSGVFSVVKVGRDIFVGMWNATEPLRSALNRIAGTLVYLLGFLGKNISGKSGSILDSGMLDNWYDNLNKVSTMLGDGLIKAFQTMIAIGSIAGKVFSKIVGIFTGGEDSISTAIGDISAVFETLRSSLFEMLGETDANASLLSSILNVLGNTVSSFTTFIANFLDTLFDVEGDTKNIVSNIASVLGGLFKGIANMFSNLTFDDVKSIAMIGSLVYLTANLGKVFDSLSFFTDKIFSLSERLKKTTSLDSFITQLNDAFDKTVILQIGVTITLLINALVKLASVDTDKLAIAVAALGGIMVGMLAVTKKMGEISKTTKPGNIAKMGVAMNIFATSLIGISTAMKVIGSMDLGSVLIALGSITAIMTGLKIFAEHLEKVDAGKLILVAASISVLAVGLTAMMAPVLAMSLIDLPNLIIGLGGLAAILAEVYLFAKNIKDIDLASLAGTSASLILLSVAITNISIAVTSLAGLNFGELIIGIGGLAAILVGLGVMVTALSSINTTSLLTVSSSLTVLSVAVSLVAHTVQNLAKLNPDKLKSSMDAMLVIMASFVAVIAALNLVTIGMDTGKLGMISVALLSLSISMIAMASALNLLEGVSWGTIGQGLVIVAGGLALLLGAAAIAQYTGIGAGIAIVVAALVGLSSILLIVAGSISMIINSMSNLMQSIIALVGVAAIFGDELPELVQIGIDAFAVGFAGILDTITENGPRITASIITIMGAISAAIMASKHSVVLAVITIGLAVLQALEQFGGPIMDSLTKVVNIMTQKLPGLMLALGDFIEQLFAGIGILVTKAFYGIVEGILNLIPIVGNDLATKLHVESELIGQMYVDGFTDTVENGLEDAEDAGADFGNAAVNGLNSKDGIDAHSPSRKTIEAGNNFNDGFIETVGSEEAKAAAAESGAELGSSAADGVGDGLDDKKDATKNKISSWWDDVISSLGLGMEIPIDIKLFGGGKTIDDSSKNKDRELSPWEEYEAMERANEEAKSKAKETGEEVGSSYAEGFGEGLSTSSAPSAGARSQAQKINDAFKDELEKLDTADKTAEALLKLWKAQNPNATDADIAVKEMELLAGQIETQSARAQISQMQYTETLQKMGESASETHEAYLKMIEDQTKLLELQNEMNQNQLQGHEATAEAFQRMNDIMHDYYYNENNGRTMAEYLKSLGFTDREIAEAAAKEAGYAIPKIVEETKDATVEATMNAGEQTVQLYAESVTTNLEGLTPTFTGFGNTYATSLGTGMTDMTDNVGTAAVTMVDTAREQASSEEMIEKWTDVGYQFDMGIIKGLERGEGELYAAVERIVRAALARAMAAAGVASPSKETMYQASMWIAGYVKELNDNGADISKAITKPITAAMNASENVFANSSAEGFNKSFLNGMNQSASMLAQKVHNLTEVTADEVDKFKNEVDLKGLFDGLLDEDEIHVQVVLDLDDTAVQGLSTKNLPMTEYPNPIDQNSLAMLSQQIQNESNRISAIEARMNLEKSSGGDSGSQMENQAQAPIINMTQNNYSPKALSRREIKRDTALLVNQVQNKMRQNPHYSMLRG